ncbi:MAG: hypothetical protein Q7R69_02870 [bacterium]|nr:hypothetical protein [bacterium]
MNTKKGCTYNFGIYGTQGGGLARKVGETYIFVTKPDCPGLGIGDDVPREWDLVPANAQAVTEDDRDQRMPGMDWSL